MPASYVAKRHLYSATHPLSSLVTARLSTVTCIHAMSHQYLALARARSVVFLRKNQKRFHGGVNSRQPTIEARISPGSDEDTVREEATELVSSQLKSTRRWHLTGEGSCLERVFRFKNFKACWAFMNDVATECNRANHHPEWTNVYNKVHVKWTTHQPAGLSAKDISMARFCDQEASRYHETEPSEAQLLEDRTHFETENQQPR